MALDADRLATAMIDSIEVLSQAVRDSDDPVDIDAFRLDMFTAIAEAIVTEIQLNAEVSTAVNTDVATTGTAAAQTGTGVQADAPGVIT